MVRLILTICFIATLAEAGGVHSRRQRHLNPKDAGASLVLDARYITGNDGDAIGTWSDRSGNANDATQGTAANKPLLKVNIQGGQPALLFDGINDSLATAYGPTSGDFTLCAVYKDSGAAGNYERIIDKNFAAGWWLGRSATNANTWGGGLLNAGAPYGIYGTLSDASAHVMLSKRGGTAHVIDADGATLTSQTVATTALDTTVIRIAVASSGSGFWSGYTFQCVYFHNQALSDALKRRIVHCASLAFKIPSS